MNAESEAYLAAYEERYGRRPIPRRVTSEATARRIRFIQARARLTQDGIYG